jgi:hypothetical protein
MKSSLLACCLLIVMACAKVPRKGVNAVELQRATYSVSYPGMVPANTAQASKTRYAVEVKVVSPAALSFGVLITDGKSMPIEVLKNNTRNYTGPYVKNDALTVIAWSTNATEVSPQQTSWLAANGAAAALEYFVNGQVRMLPIKEFEKVNPDRVNQ